MSFFFRRRNGSPSESEPSSDQNNSAPSNSDSNEIPNTDGSPNEEDRAALLALYGGTTLGVGRGPSKAKYDFATDEELVSERNQINSIII